MRLFIYLVSIIAFAQQPSGPIFTLKAVSLFNPKPLVGIAAPVVTPDAKYPQWLDYTFHLGPGWGCDSHKGGKTSSVHCSLYTSSVTGFKPKAMTAPMITPGYGCRVTTNATNGPATVTDFSVYCNTRDAIAAITSSEAK